LTGPRATIYRCAALSTASARHSVHIVTGAASGIGRAIAERLALDGFSVLAADIDGDEAEAVAAGIRGAGGTAGAFTVDVGSSDECAAAVRAATSLGELGGLVNVAGIMTSSDSVATVTDAELERIFAVNVHAIFRLGRHVIPALRAAGGGVIVNTASVHAFATMPGCATYAASKGAIVALTRQMAIDLAQDRIRVVAVAPGSVDTPLTRRELARIGRTAEEAGFPRDPCRIGRMAEPSELADVVSWLVSEQARFVNGTTVVADGGLLAKLV
jgi:NAD(P)-dependent dehydrogenase (short-subunit alcohol dehydrogenase family)